MFEMKFQYFVTNIPAVDTLFEASFTTLSDTGKPFSRCGKCRRYMKLVQTKPQRLYCPTCQETYAVPNFKDGVLKVIGDHKCPLDDFDVILYQGPGGKLARTFTLCPFCFNNPPFEKMPQGAGCDTCVHPSCQYSISSNGVCGCLQDCGGVMLLDTQSHPKWRMTCNKCPSVVGLFEGAIKVKVDSTRSLFFSYILDVFRIIIGEIGGFRKWKKKTPPLQRYFSKNFKGFSRKTLKCCKKIGFFFPQKIDFPVFWHVLEPNSGKPGAIEYESSSYEGCIFCDAMKKYPDAINLNHAYLTEESRQRNTQAPRRGGGGGRGRGGRGRGGRGRGRGRGR
nr:hypothetical protein Y48C3A.r - Caenorhabditis elegans [Caenorhabditis elegans]